MTRKETYGLNTEVNVFNNSIRIAMVSLVFFFPPCWTTSAGLQCTTPKVRANPSPGWLWPQGGTLIFRPGPLCLHPSTLCLFEPQHLNQCLIYRRFLLIEFLLIEWVKKNVKCPARRARDVAALRKCQLVAPAHCSDSYIKSNACDLDILK